MKNKIQALERLIAKYENDHTKADLVAKTRAKLAELTGKQTGGPKLVLTPKKEECNDILKKSLDAIESLIENSGGDIDVKKLKKILANQKITASQLGEDVVAMIESTKNVVLSPLPNIEIDMGDNLADIFWIAFSDLEAKNNVYLYGGAGTGKTFTSEQLAKALNCSLITINCNQYTSPLEIIGGQTIEGYQEGKLITAWANLTEADEGVSGGMQEGTNGCLLLLDELPKLDPNTAGLLNDALAKIKDGSPKIQSARGEVFTKKRFFCIATGNSKLNEESTDYVATFRQDLSLQDRFAGSTYEVFVNLDVERKLMDGFLFIFIYMNKVRNLIVSKEGKAQNMASKAFVSLRIMQSLRDSWRYWYENHDQEPKIKTINDGVESFFELFTPKQAKWLREKSNYSSFLKVVNNQKTMPLGSDTGADIDEARIIVDKWRKNKDQRF